MSPFFFSSDAKKMADMEEQEAGQRGRERGKYGRYSCLLFEGLLDSYHNGGNLDVWWCGEIGRAHV